MLYIGQIMIVLYIVLRQQEQEELTSEALANLL